MDKEFITLCRKKIKIKIKDNSHKTFYFQQIGNDNKGKLNPANCHPAHHIFSFACQ